MHVRLRKGVRASAATARDAPRPIVGAGALAIMHYNTQATRGGGADNTPCTTNTQRAYVGVYRRNSTRARKQQYHDMMNPLGIC